MHFTGTVYRNPYWPTFPLLQITQGWILRSSMEIWTEWQQSEIVNVHCNYAWAHKDKIHMNKKQKVNALKDKMQKSGHESPLLFIVD